MNALANKIYNAMLKDISERKLSVGDRIPTEMELAKKFGGNRMNAHNAVKKLEADGIVERKKRQGTFIKKTFSDDAIIDLRNKTVNVAHVFLGQSSPKSFTQWDESTITELESLLNESSYKLFYNEMPSTRTEFLESFEKIERTGSRCVILFPAGGDLKFLRENLDVMTKYRGDIFLMNRGTHPPQNFPCHSLSLDPFGEGAIAGMHLLEKACSRIIFIGNSIGQSYWAQQRAEGLQCALKDSGALAEIIEFSKGDAFKKVVALIKDSEEKVAVVAQNDAFASEFLEEAQRKKLKVQTDFLLMGFDNDPRARKHNLTTVAPPVDKIAKVLAKMIIEQRWKKIEGALVSLRIASRIIERSTS